MSFLLDFFNVTKKIIFFLLEKRGEDMKIKSNIRDIITLIVNVIESSQKTDS
jgi:hypothetical protein